MELWIPITIAAAFLQNLRSALQKHLQGSLGTRGASFVRFGYGFPLAILYALSLHWIAGLDGSSETGGIIVCRVQSFLADLLNIGQQILGAYNVPDRRRQRRGRRDRRNGLRRLRGRVIGIAGDRTFRRWLRGLLRPG